MSRGRLIGVVVLAAIVTVPIARAVTLHTRASGRPIQVGIVYDPGSFPEQATIRAAWDAVLEEEGVPYRWVPTTDLGLRDGTTLARQFRALVFPDAVAARLPSELGERIEEYVREGGQAGIVYDAGVYDPNGTYRSGGLFAEMLGTQYLLYDDRGDDAYVEGKIGFVSREAAARWHVPPGKLVRDVVSGYSYGNLAYSMAATERLASDVRVQAEFDGMPVITERDVGRGTAVFVDLPLGALKAHSDDLPLRSFVRTFLFSIAEVPHLVSAPEGVGGLVIDWHVDANSEWITLPKLERDGLLREDVTMQFDVTAGPYRDEPGDGLGFDACGTEQGRELVALMLRYGEVGSHGGWSHNHFSYGWDEGDIDDAEAEAFIRKNDACIEELTGRPVRVYSAPNGTHPQPEATRIMEREGIDGYYYTGDTGAPPNRTFFDGEMVSREVFAFPVMPNGLQASIGEMILDGQSPSEIRRWLDATLDYVVDDQTVRLIYSHPYDLQRAAYRDAFAGFLDRVERFQDDGSLTTGTMASYAAFLRRFLTVDQTYRIEDDRVVVELRSDAGLDGIPVSLPTSLVGDAPSAPEGTTEVHAPDGWSTFVVEGDEDAVTLEFPLAG